MAFGAGLSQSVVFLCSCGVSKRCAFGAATVTRPEVTDVADVQAGPGSVL